MILVIDDDIAVQTSLMLLLKTENYEVQAASGPEAALGILSRETVSLIILDLNFSLDTSGHEGIRLLKQIRRQNPEIPVILITGWGSIPLAVEGMKQGASDFINKPWDNDYLLQSVKTLIELKAKKSQSRSRKQLDEQFSFKHIIGEDPKMLELLETVGNVAATDASVLIMGESGTGKELIAEAIHNNSNRRNGPFVKVNLGGISTSLFESEMFGHVRGAFTDARYDRTGRFELANKGTIFLDEIGDLDAVSQVKLLRVLQDRTYEVLGSSRTKTVNVRIICATNRNLEEMVDAGSFREDLLYRINLITIRMPPLRERRGDIGLLANFFMENLKEIYNRPQLRISKAAITYLQQLALPGNIRQLKNLVERTVLVNRNNELEASDFKPLYETTAVKKETLQLPGVGSITLEDLEIEMIRRAMLYHKNRISKAALSLGLTRSALYRRLEKYDIPYDETAD